MSRPNWWKALLAAAWLGALGYLLYWMQDADVSFRELPGVIRYLVRSSGSWGPVVIIALYLIRSFVPLFPETILLLLGGSLFGPVWGLVLNIVGENLSANISFVFGRILGRRFVREHEHGWLKASDEALRREGFLVVFFARALFVPFDIVNFGCGMSGIIYRQYALGTLLGMLPVTIALTIMGDAFTKPKTLILSGALLMTMVIVALMLKRTPWIRKRLSPEHVQEHF